MTFIPMSDYLHQLKAAVFAGIVGSSLLIVNNVYAYDDPIDAFSRGYDKAQGVNSRILNDMRNMRLEDERMNQERQLYELQRQRQQYELQQRAIQQEQLMHQQTARVPYIVVIGMNAIRDTKFFENHTSLIQIKDKLKGEVKKGGNSASLENKLKCIDDEIEHLNAEIDTQFKQALVSFRTKADIVVLDLNKEIGKNGMMIINNDANKFPIHYANEEVISIINANYHDREKSSKCL